MQAFHSIVFDHPGVQAAAKDFTGQQLLCVKPMNTDTEDRRKCHAYCLSEVIGALTDEELWPLSPDPSPGQFSALSLKDSLWDISSHAHVIPGHEECMEAMGTQH